MDLTTFWFIVIGVLWTGYLVLEGFDFGVGMLLPVLGGKRYPDAAEPRSAAASCSTRSARSGTATRCGCSPPAARPSPPSRTGTPRCSAASTCRCCSSSWRSSCATSASSTATSAPTAQWKARWDQAIFWGSLVPALLWGVALTNIVRGVPIDADKEFTGNLFTLLNPCRPARRTRLRHALPHPRRDLHRAQDRRRRSATRRGRSPSVSASCAAVLAVALLLWIGLTDGKRRLVGHDRGRRRRAPRRRSRPTGPGREGWAFIGTAVTIAMAVATYFLVLFPNVMPSTTNPAGTSR